MSKTQTVERVQHSFAPESFAGTALRTDPIKISVGTVNTAYSLIVAMMSNKIFIAVC